MGTVLKELWPNQLFRMGSTRRRVNFQAQILFWGGLAIIMMFLRGLMMVADCLQKDQCR